MRFIGNKEPIIVDREPPEEPKVNGAPAFTYGERDGYCVDSFGAPGGELGETVKKLQELQMLKSQ